MKLWIVSYHWQSRVMKKKRLIFGILVGIIIICFAIMLINKANNSTKTNEVTLNSSEPDENGLYFAEDYVFSKMEPFEESYIHSMSEKLNRAYETLLNSNMNVYYSVIPDKGYFIENPSFTKENYESMLDILTNEVKHMEYIPIMDKLSITDYYKTDHHWRQEKLFPVVNQLGKFMDFKIDKSDFTEHVVENFKGVHSEYMDVVPEESLIYMTNKVTDEATVEIYGVGEYQGVYFLDELNTDVAYNVFLKGLAPIVTITNPYATDERELILFGDSYASSIAPLLLQAYSKITVIDMRFAPMSYLPEVMEFTTQDVLFLYNTAVINRSAMLKFQ